MAKIADVRDQLESRALARVKLRARRKRVRIIRRRTYWFSATVFALVWVVIFAQLASGHDPALSRKHRRPAAVAERRSAGAHARRPARIRREVRARRPRHHHHHHHHVAAVSTPAPASSSTPAPAPAPAPQPAPVTTSQS